ncbi:hypothetical protein AwPolaro_07150 [Polaromonas sp.]|nr:hypothetical protein AwPolaro_07150 [Polaromonas sp.]
MKQLEVKIMGQSYLLACPENGEDQLRQSVGVVDSSMCKIRDAGKIKARDRIAVLVALNLAFELSERTEPDLIDASADSTDSALTKAAQELALRAQTTRLSLLVLRLDAALART